MRTVRPAASLLFLAASIAGCSDAAGPPLTKAPEAPLLAASVVHGTGVFNAGGPVYLDCLGETVDHWFSVPYKYTSVTTPGGGSVFSDHFVVGEATGQLWGLTSGTVWTAGRTISPEVSTATAGSTFIFTANIFWVSETGPTIHLHGQYTFVQNANGDIVVDKSSNKAGCTLQ